MSHIRFKDEAEFSAFEARRQSRNSKLPTSSTLTPELKQAQQALNSRRSQMLNQAARFQALGRLPKGRMNKTEQAYAEILDVQKASGRILDYKFHAIRVRLADNTYYEPDFLVLNGKSEIEIHETKGGFTTDKGRLKVKLAAEALGWFRILLCHKLPKKAGGGWRVEQFGAETT